MSRKVFYSLIAGLFLLIIVLPWIISWFQQKDFQFWKKDSTGVSPTPTPAEKETYVNPPEMMIDVSKKYFAKMNTTAGLITLELFADKTPITVNNFVFLSQDGFYDQTFFHRVIKNFMIQGGDPTGTGRGSPGYAFDDESFSGEYTRGTLAMANSGPNTNGSQFFIMHQDYNLSPDYVIFGRVVDGWEVLDEIASAEVMANDLGELSLAVNPVFINQIEIVIE